MVTKIDYIVDTKKLILHQIKYDGLWDLKGNGNFERRDKYFPIINNKGENIYPNYKSNNTQYVFGRGILGEGYSSAQKIEKWNKANKVQREYVIISINNFNLEVIEERFYHYSKDC